MVLCKLIGKEGVFASARIHRFMSMLEELHLHYLFVFSFEGTGGL